MNVEPDTIGDTDAEHMVSSIAISLKRIADAMDNPGSEKGSILWWLETIASAANAGRS